MPSSPNWRGRAAGLAALAAISVTSMVHAQIPQSCEALVRSMAETGSVKLTGVNFDFNRSNLRQDSLPALVALASVFAPLAAIH